MDVLTSMWRLYACPCSAVPSPSVYLLHSCSQVRLSPSVAVTLLSAVGIPPVIFGWNMLGNMSGC